MEPESTLPRKKLPLVPLAVALAAVAALAYLLSRGVDFKALEDRIVGTVRGLGPWAFFSAMAILPAFSVPLSLFTLTAGELFAPLMTLPGVIVAAFVAIGINMVLTYWLARYALRPLLSRVIARYGYTIPKITRANALSATLALRLTPGPPFFIQSYILGMAEIPFRLYIVTSLICQVPWGIGFIVLGKGVFNKNFSLVMYGIGVLVVAGVVVNWLRRKNAAPTA
jgi:uncharacterized membrane protein YdjX (TVP38/TMEM64 family)